MVKDLAHSLLADDERLVADAMPHVAVGVAGGVRVAAGWRAWRWRRLRQRRRVRSSRVAGRCPLRGQSERLAECGGGGSTARLRRRAR